LHHKVLSLSLVSQLDTKEEKAADDYMI